MGANVSTQYRNRLSAQAAHSSRIASEQKLLGDHAIDEAEKLNPPLLPRRLCMSGTCSDFQDAPLKTASAGCSVE